MELIINQAGLVRCIYTETIDLTQLGALVINRGSYVEPAADGQWTADLSPVNGPLLGPFSRRSGALAAEHDWLNQHWLFSSP
ncbi:hypothetical protein [Gimesia chilikensis]|uniref:Uncharacterized protein n=1 Tax=Gimesia chilikensis TaxID=2605989 RepID=A0A517PPU8_9PLAN|nr:hypothetical protein [Gimesia chilikensis]QDT21402.1 hypothetical protein HG66A1_32030 [Gimesia chilikensis]